MTTLFSVLAVLGIVLIVIFICAIIDSHVFKRIERIEKRLDKLYPIEDELTFGGRRTLKDRISDLEDQMLKIHQFYYVEDADDKSLIDMYQELNSKIRDLEMKVNTVENYGRSLSDLTHITYSKAKKCEDYIFVGDDPNKMQTTTGGEY